MEYHHLTQEERYLIYVYKKTDKSQSEIAKLLGRDKSSISRELKRNTGSNGYRPKQAHNMATERFQSAEKLIKMTTSVILKIEEGILLNWSPEQISGRLFKDDGISISHERIYQYILEDKNNGGDLYIHLRCQKKRKKRYGTKSHDRRGQIPDKVSIEDRPSIVDEKNRIGDWEGDLVIGKNHKGALITLVDRKSKKVRILKVDSKDATVVQMGICSMLADETVLTVTFDNGKEFTQHKLMTETIGAKIYFAHPYSSWERGLNENTNGLIRQYFKKGSSFETITAKDVRKVEEALNNRPRKMLGFNTPNEIYTGQRRVPKVA